MLSFLNTIFMFSYVAGSSFPKPLTQEEEAKYINLYLQGDMDAKNILIEHNLRLVAHIVKKYSNYSKDADDLISVGTIGLIKGISSYDATKGTRLATYVSRCIENEILMLIRTGKKYGNEVYLQEPIGMDNEGNEFSLTS